MAYTPYTWPAGSTIRSTDLQHAETQYGQLSSDYLYQYSTGATTIFSASSINSIYYATVAASFERTVWIVDIPANVLPSTFDITFGITVTCSSMIGSMYVRKETGPTVQAGMASPFSYTTGIIKSIPMVTSSGATLHTFTTTISIPSPGRYFFNAYFTQSMGGGATLQARDLFFKGVRVNPSTNPGFLVQYAAT